MKAVVLAAGFGSRIAAITDGAPKSLLPLADTTLLGHTFRMLEGCGVTDLVIVTGYERRQIEDYTAKHWKGPQEFVYNPHFSTTNVLYSFWLALPYLHGHDVVFVHADTVFSQAVLERLLASGREHPIVFAVDDHVCAEEEMKVQVAGGKVTLVTKEMDAATCHGEFLGIARLDAATLPILRKEAEILFENQTFKAFFELAVQAGINNGSLSVGVCDVTGEKWREVDFEEDYEAARELFPT